MLISFVKNKTLLCIADYYIMFPIVKRADSLADDELVKAANTILQNLYSPGNSFQVQA